MKRNIGPTTLVLIVFAMFVVSIASPSALAQQCSLAGTAGAYGFTATGTLLLSTGAVHNRGRRQNQPPRRRDSLGNGGPKCGWRFR
jgi:hypothetical protein